MNKFIIAFSVFFIACSSNAIKDKSVNKPLNWISNSNKDPSYVSAKDLENWWFKFEDPTLNKLISEALIESPEIKIAIQRIKEARAIRKSRRAALFPEIGISGQRGVSSNSFFEAEDSFFDAKFDATYELDVFGRIRKGVEAEEANIEALKANYNNVNLTLIAEIARAYIDYREAKKQRKIAKENLNIQENTLSIIYKRVKFGESPQLDIERGKNIVSQTKSSIPEFRRLEENALYQLARLSGKLPQDILWLNNTKAKIPKFDIKPVLLKPADVIANRPDIKIASYNLLRQTALTEVEIRNLYPRFNLSAFYGIAELVLTDANRAWSVALGTSVSLLNFGRLRANIDAAKAREVRAFEEYRITILNGVREVETALNDYSKINKQRLHLSDVLKSAKKAFNLSKTLYAEGEISFLDVLDSQRTVVSANSELIRAEARQAESLVRVYKALGVGVEKRDFIKKNQ